MSESARREAFVDKISISLFEPHTLRQRELHETLIIALAAINILTIVATFLAAPAI